MKKMQASEKILNIITQDDHFKSFLIKEDFLDKVYQKEIIRDANGIFKVFEVLNIDFL